MIKHIKNILKITVFTGKMIGTVVETALFGSFVHADEYSNIVEIRNQY